MSASSKTGLLAAVLLATSLDAFAQVPAATTPQLPSLTAARTLYASAEYGGALDMLNGLLAEHPSIADLQAIDLYRALCFVAQGEMPEATRIIDGMIGREPLYRPASDDVPPRLRAVFADSRRRLLPAILQQQYASAKVAFDQKVYANAAQAFSHVLAGLSDPDMEAVASQPPLADLKILATGFHELAAKAALPPPAPVVAAAAPAPVPDPVVAETAPRVYSVTDRNVVPPLVIRQVVPPYPGKVIIAGTSMMEVIIDTAGGVESAVLDVPLNPVYDRIALSAARSWQYQPATVDGKPVKFRKRIQISLVPTTPAR